jgi:predicted MPP superfamily phosphohydrolase
MHTTNYKKTIMKKSVIVVVEVVIVFVTLLYIMNDSIQATIEFNQDGTFKIAQFADLHFGEGENVDWGPMQDTKSLRVMKTMIEMEKPDLVVFSGDQITGNNIQKNATLYWKQLVSVCLESKTKWTSIFGNHDDIAFQPEKNSITSRHELIEFEQQWDGLCLSEIGPRHIHGVSNYVHVLKDQSSGGDRFVLYFMDSGGGSVPEVIFPDQVHWFKQKHLRHKHIPAIVFFHIPLQEYNNLYDENKCIGYKNDSIAQQSENHGMFDAMKKSEDVKAVFVGHNHGNDFCCMKEGVYLCYGRHTGYGGYGRWERGSRIIMLSQFGKQIETWVRLESGRVTNYLKI